MRTGWSSVSTRWPGSPAWLRPGIGLRPGGERPQLEDDVVVLFDALYAAVAAWSRAGLNVIVDVGHHDDYSRPLGILARTASTLRGLPAYFVGVRCSLEATMARRDADPRGGGGRYATSEPDGSVPPVVVRWERAVHHPGLYDLEVDTSTSTPGACAAAILRRVRQGPPVAFATLAKRDDRDEAKPSGSIDEGQAAADPATSAQRASQGRH
jgi:chloramphenicol 3-O phosphotransferase